MPHGPESHGHKAGIDFSVHTLRRLEGVSFPPGLDSGQRNIIITIENEDLSQRESDLKGSSVYIPGKPKAVYE